MNIYRFVVTFAVHAPNLIQQLQPGKGPFRISQQLVQEVELLGRQHLRIVAAPHGVGVVVQLDIPYRDFVFIHDAGAAQQRLDAQHKLLPVRRFCHIIIGTNDKARVLVLRHILGRQHQNGQHAAAFADSLCQRKAVHPGHHHIAEQQVYLVVVEQFQRLHTVGSNQRLIARSLYDGAKQTRCAGVILGNQNTKHPCILLSSIIVQRKDKRKINLPVYQRFILAVYP